MVEKWKGKKKVKQKKKDAQFGAHKKRRASGLVCLHEAAVLCFVLLWFFRFVWLLFGVRNFSDVLIVKGEWRKRADGMTSTSLSGTV